MNSKNSKIPVLGGKNKAWKGDIPGTIEIELTQGKVAIIDEEDWFKIRGFNWHMNHERAGRMYAHAMFNWNRNKHQSFKLHRILLSVNTNQIIDHINRQTLDNRKSNLRICSRNQNQHNHGVSKKNKSGFIGVYYNKKDHKWFAQIRNNNKLIYIGYFTNPIEAARARDKKAIELHGEFAKLNEIPS